MRALNPWTRFAFGSVFFFVSSVFVFISLFGPRLTLWPLLLRPVLLLWLLWLLAGLCTLRWLCWSRWSGGQAVKVVRRSRWSGGQVVRRLMPLLVDHLKCGVMQAFLAWKLVHRFPPLRSGLPLYVALLGPPILLETS